MKLPMKTIALAVAAMSWCIVAFAADSERDPGNGKYPIEELVMRGMAMPDELIVRTSVTMSAVTFLDFLRENLPDLVFSLKGESIGNRLVVLGVDRSGESSLRDKAESLQAVANFLNRASIPTEANLLMSILAAPGDVHYQKQCGLKAINAEKAWGTLKGADASHVDVAIVDSGLADHHDDLHPNAKPASNADLDANGHGTHVAGIIGAVRDDQKGIVGVTWKIDIKAYRFLDDRGIGKLSDALRKIEGAINGGAHIIVLAWGTGARSEELFETLKKANRVLFVTAAGNLGEDTEIHPVYPAAYELENVISVMATSCDDQRARFSNFSAVRVDLAAPGEGLARNMRIFSTVLNQRWGNLAGTSMSAAFVAGAAALVLEPSIVAGNPHTPKQVKCWLNATVAKLPDLAGRSKSGGRLELAEAVKPLNETTCQR